MSDPQPSPSAFPGVAPTGTARGPVVADASSWGVLEVAGPDASRFLQGQLSSDVEALGPGTGQWTSYNSPKGRMLANGWLWRDPDEARFGFTLAAELAEPIRKRLAMFVLRSRVTVADVTGRLARIGVGGERADAIMAAALAMPAPPGPGSVTAVDGIRALALPDGRWLVLAPDDLAEPLRARLAAQARVGDATDWRRLGIRAGIGLVTAPTQDLFVAQTANWDAVGGVSFRKGCYTGQEIIARTQYLGRLKERLHRFTTPDLAPSPGDRLYSRAFADQACGTVVDAVAREDGGSELLAVVQQAAVASGDVHLRAPDGPVLTEAPLPYALPEAVAASRPRLS